MSIAEKLVTIAENEQKVYKAGQQAEYDTFWDNYQQNGNRTNYENAFAGYGWNAETFKPKYDIKPTSAYMLFRYCNLGSNFDLVEYLDNLGLTLDFSICTNVQYAFYGANIKRIGVIDFRNAEGSFATRALDSAYLETVDLLKVGEKNTTLDWFATARRLQNLTIEGVIVANLNVKACPLTHNSLMSIINALKNFSGTETFANVEYVWTGNATSYSYDMVYNVIDIYDANDDFLSLQLETDELFEIPDGTGTTIPATLILEIHNFTYDGDVTKIKTAMISSDGTLTLTFKAEPTKTLTLHADSKAKLTAAQIQSAEDKGWNVV